MNNLGKIAAVSLGVSSCLHPNLSPKEDGRSGVPELADERFRDLFVNILDEFNRSSINSPSILVGEGEDMSLVPAPSFDEKAKERAATVMLGILEGQIGAITDAIESGKRDRSGPFLKRNFPVPFGMHPGSELGQINNVGYAPVDWYETKDSVLTNCAVANLQWPRGLTQTSPESFLYVSCAEPRAEFKEASHGDEDGYYTNLEWVPIYEGKERYYWAVYANFPEGTGNNLTLGGSDLFYYQLSSDSTSRPYWFVLAGAEEKTYGVYPNDPGFSYKNNVSFGVSVLEAPGGEVNVYGTSQLFDKNNCYHIRLGRAFAYDSETNGFDEERPEVNAGNLNEGPYCPRGEQGAYTMTWNEESSQQIRNDFDRLSQLVPNGAKKEMDGSNPNRFFVGSEGRVFAQ